MTPLNRTGARCFEFLLTLWISLILCASFSLDAFRLQYVNEANWNWRLMKTILTRCHVYDKERYYVPFDELAPEESQPIKFLRKFMPDYAWCHGYCWLEYHWPGEQYNDLEDTQSWRHFLTPLMHTPNFDRITMPNCVAEKEKQLFLKGCWKIMPIFSRLYALHRFLNMKHLYGSLIHLYIII